jgi:hypothetical protein
MVYRLVQVGVPVVVAEAAEAATAVLEAVGVLIVVMVLAVSGWLLGWAIQGRGTSWWICM